MEITIYNDLYFEQALNGKHLLLNVLENLGFKVKMHVLCFGSLGNISKKCSKMVQKIYKNHEKAKNTLKWCSIFIIIGANYIWQNRVKKLLV